MTEAYSEIIKHETDDWEEFLERISLIHVFAPVIKEYTDRDLLKGVIRYIVYAYSRNSEHVVLGMDWQENKKKIFEAVLIKPMEGPYVDLIHLKKEAVLQTVHNWLEFQDNDTWKQLQVLKDLRVEMQLSANSPISTSSKAIDYDQKFKNAEYAMKLKAMIKDLEQELIQNDGKLKEAVKEVKAKEKNNTQRSVGSYAVS